jgi:hypothetical protein
VSGPDPSNNLLRSKALNPHGIEATRGHRRRSVSHGGQSAALTDDEGSPLPFAPPLWRYARPSGLMAMQEAQARCVFLVGIARTATVPLA